MALALPTGVRPEWVLGLADAWDPQSAKATLDRERREAIDDIRAFARHVFIQTPEGDAVSFATVAWPWQIALLALWVVTKLCVTLKARQLGVSWIGAIYALWSAMRRPGQSVLLISKGQDDAEKLLAKVAFVYNRLPAWRPRAMVNARSIRFPGLGSEIEALPATEGVGRSRTATLVILDEHAHQRWARKILLAVKAAAEQGQILSISSANGQGALHSQLYLGAKADQPLASTQMPDGTPLPIRVTRDVGPNGWRAVFVPASAHPARTGNWRVRARAELEQLSDADFAQEYPENDIEAIQTTGRPVFRPEDLNRQPIEMGTAGEPGHVIFREPAAGKSYVVGADVGEGLATSDWSSATVIERDSGEQVARLRGRWTPDVFAEKVDRLARHYAQHADAANRQPVIVAVERNNHGHAVLLRLAQLHAGTGPYRVFRAKDKRTGWLTSTATRPVLVDELEAALRTGAVAIHDAGTVDQLSTFAYSDDGRPEAQEGYHDDDVLALGIAWQVRRRSFGRVLGVTRGEEKAA
jgi:hypothetical protein